MPKLFIATSFAVLCCLLTPVVYAWDDLCPAPSTATGLDATQTPPSNEALEQAMRAAASSANQNFDWFNAPGSNSCGGYYLEPENPSLQRQTPAELADSIISADSFKQDASGLLTLSGDVQIYQGSRRIRCDSLLLQRQQRYSELSGNVQIREPGILLMADKATVDDSKQLSELFNASFLLHEQQARGEAKYIAVDNSQGLTADLQDSSFTFCPRHAEHWAFQAKSVELDREKGWGTLRSAVFKVQRVPIMYIPYLNFPIDDRRKTGVLWPTISGGKSYFDFALPIYFNLAPNYDMTYTPRVLTQHGLMHNLEGRYKQRYSDWVIGGSYIEPDRRVNGVQTKKDKSLDKQRWLGFIQQKGQFNANWSSFIDYQAISDIHYFRDWGTTGLDIQKSLNMKREAAIAYNDSNWTATARIVDYENLEQNAITGRTLEEDYKLWPSIDVGFRNAQRSFTVEPLLQAQYTYFQHDTRTTGHRLFAASGASFPMRWQAVEVIPSAQVKTVQYHLDNDNKTVANQYYEGQHGVQVPTFSLDSRIHFERRDSDSSSTLSPRLFYYYAHHRKQDKLPTFDAGMMDFSYQQVWREGRLSGYDRIDNANQLSWGIDNSWANKGRTIVDIGIGQILYFDDREVSPRIGDRTLSVISATDHENLQDAKKQANYEKYKRYTRNASDIAMQANWYPAEFHNIRGTLITDPYQKKVSETALGYHYSDDKNYIFNVAYRYQYQPDTYDALTQSLIEKDTQQIDGSFYVPISNQWQIYASSQYDVSHSEFIENLTGLKYEGCCWGIMLAYKRERKTFSGNTRVSETEKTEYRNYWFLQFELKGLGGVTNVISRLLEERIEGYQSK